MRATSVLISLVVLLASSDALSQVKRVQRDTYDHLIETGEGNFALTSPQLLQHNRNWNTNSVTVNGNDVMFVSKECQYSLRQLDSLGVEDRTVLRQARGSFSNKGNLLLARHHGGQLKEGFQCKYDLQSGELLWASSFGEQKFAALDVDGISVTKYGQDKYTASGQDFAKNLVRLFVDEQVATFVYRDGKIRMKPKVCLESSEARLIQQATQALR